MTTRTAERQPATARTTPAETWTRETYKAQERWRWVASISYNTIFDLQS